MNARVRARWVAALRSGEFQQGRGRLHKIYDGQHSYCCLGVLCELATRDGVVLSAPRPSASAEQHEVVTYDGASTYLPPVVVAWAELNTGDPVVDGRSLSARNDGNSLAAGSESFELIADLIEANL